MTTPITTLVMVPQADESAPLLAAFAALGHKPSHCRVGRLDVACLAALELGVAVGGHGKVQLAVQTQHLLDLLPSVQTVVCAGAAGSLSPAARWGDVVIGSCSVEHDYKLRFVVEPLPIHIADPRLVEELLAVTADWRGDFRILSGPIASGDEDVIEPARARELHAETGALCVAWEGAGAARAAAFVGRRFVELRVITDAADADAAADFHASLEVVLPRLADVLLAWATARCGLTSTSSRQAPQV
jgi:adenosylhomocysteine nucleosidase